jgi:hypothetical protein
MDRVSEGLWLRVKGDPHRMSDGELLDMLQSLPLEDAVEAIKWAYTPEEDDE